MPATDPTSAPDPAHPAARSRDLSDEQLVVDQLFERLDRVREEAALRRDRALQDHEIAATPQGRSERDAFVAFHEQRLRQLRDTEAGLVFGRLDRAAGEDSAVEQILYIGRIGLHDDRQRQMLLDWRASAAQDFYQATAASPRDVRRRRHLKVRDRSVVAVHDDLIPTTRDRATEPSDYTGEAALLAAVNEARSGRMRDIVVTLQAEQDDIIRAPLSGVLVVQGAPGTGKTAVALHRAAYLLYTHRDRLSASGVLLIGPNHRFLQYIEDVLPGLGETSVISTTVVGLYPDQAVSTSDAPVAARLKGDLRMSAVLANAVALRQRSPATPITLAVEDATVVLEPDVVAEAREIARASGQPHNRAREEFCRIVLDDLVTQLAQVWGEPEDDIARAQLLHLLHASPAVRREVNLCWMPLVPEQLLSRLWGDAVALAEAAEGILTPAEQAVLGRDGTSGTWSEGDIPLLDELAARVGEAPENRQARAARRREEDEQAEQLRFARESLSSMGIDERAVPAELLASRYRTEVHPLNLFERAADREWTYGHVVVDEAQELSQMAWRMIIRRCPTRSMTVVGDTAQTTSPAGATSWSDTFDVHAPDKWRLEELSINYRTPGAVMDLATRVAGPSTLQPVRSLRRGRVPGAVRVRNIGQAAVMKVLADPDLVHPQGTSAVIVADPAARARLSRIEAVPVITANDAKGLEFDTVILIEPASFLGAGERGRRELYVALTRPTQRLVVLHSAPLPTGFDGLVRRQRLGSVDT